MLSPGERSSGELLASLGMWRTIERGDGEETPATWGRVATRRCSAGAFQGNMAGGGGGFSPEAQCGAAAASLTKEKLSERRSWGCGGGGAGAAVNEAGDGERVGITAVHPWAEASGDAAIVFLPRRPAHLVVRVF